ncbi:MAG: RNA polymerase sporulation sigma factor SigH [Dorea sp.]
MQLEKSKYRKSGLKEKNMTEYKQMTDEQLIRKLREGETGIIDYLMEKYKNLVRKEANAMYLLGGETDDLIQEGMIGLFKAVQDYDLDQEASFFSFARLCVTRQLYSAIEASKRKKHSPLNSYISLYEKEDGQGSLIDTMEAEQETNPEELMVSQERARRIEENLEQELSDLEKRGIYLHLLGTDYKKIADLLDRSPKTVDNALQRIKGKTQKILEKENKNIR